MWDGVAMVISVQDSKRGKKTLSDVMWLSWINGAISELKVGGVPG
jgi:hypothetical protein